MNQILPYLLWVGHEGHGRDFRLLFDNGIRALVQLALDEEPVQPPRELISCRFPLLDGTGNRPEVLRLSIDTVASLLRMHVPALVCGGSGVSRAPAVAAAALAVAHQDTPEVCLQRVVEHHPCDVSPSLWSEITGVLHSPGIKPSVQ
jgi:hypothetical protein